MVCSFAQLKSACILSYFWLSNLYAIAITCFPVAMYLMILYKEKEIRSNIFLFFLVSILLFCSTLRNRILGQRETCTEVHKGYRLYNITLILQME